MTKQFLTLNLRAQITSCSQLTQSNLVVAFRGGVGTTDGYAFTCNAPDASSLTQPLSYTLSPGASMGVGCSTKTQVNNTGDSAYVASGIGTATLYSDCESFNLGSVSDPPSTCTDALATGNYAWSVDVPIPQPGPGVRPPH